MANTICIYTFIKFMCTFLDITCKSIIDDNDCTELRALLMLMFVRTVDILRVSINQYPKHFGRFYISSYLRDGQSY